MTLHEHKDKLERDIFHISEAVEALKDVEDVEDVVGALKDRLIWLHVQWADVHHEIEVMDERDERDLTLEYWRSVI